MVCCCVNFRARSLCTCFRLPAAGGPLLTSFVPFRKSPLTPAHSHSSSHSRPHPLSFHIHPQNTREVRSFSHFFTPRSFHDPQLSALFVFNRSRTLSFLIYDLTPSPSSACALLSKNTGVPPHPSSQRRARLDFAVVRASSFLLSLQSTNQPQTGNHYSQLTIHRAPLILPSWQDGNACPTTMLRRILRGAYTGPDEFVLEQVSTRGSPLRLPARSLSSGDGIH